MNEKFDVIYRIFIDEQGHSRTTPEQLAYYIKHRDNIISLLPDFIDQLASYLDRTFFVCQLLTCVITSKENDDTRTRIINEIRKKVPMRCPEKGEFIGYKKVFIKATYDKGGQIKVTYGIAKLRIPETAQRSSAFGSKCRCSEAFVEEITSMDGLIKYDSAMSIRGIDTTLSWRAPVTIDDSMNAKYIVGETVKPDSFDPDWWIECSNGIHFFMTREEAENYIQ